MAYSRISVRTSLLAAAVALSACSAESPRSLAEYIAALCAAPFRSAPTDEAPFLAENVSAMTKMMIDMTIQPSGDVDKDFVAMMTPHHQAAIEMALAQLRHGRNERLKRIAQEIIITQQQEIVAMRLAVGLPIPAPRTDQMSSAAPAGAKAKEQYSTD